ncbi:MAG: hypothetical protein IJX08_08950 [Clostridia bacterium]|nr:hypothetical protein [Clostridia bacterium]
MKKVFKIVLKVVLALLALIVALVLLVFGGLNLAKFVLYDDYYAMKSDLCKNPGLSDGFVCQGICALEAEDKILVSGYMKDDSASRIYVTDLEDHSFYVNLSKEGKDFTGHAGGVAVHGDTIYVASGKAVHLLPVDTVLNAQNGDTVEFTESIPVNNSASFIYADEQYLYVGEFHDGGSYVTDHPYETPEGLHHAIVSCYEYDDLTAPTKIYSLRDKVQGICFTPDGSVVLSTSYGLADSVYYLYHLDDAIESGLTLDGAPVYYLDQCQKEINGPAMAEGLDYYDGKVITLTESASDKYIYGKFFFANQIVALDFSK